MREKTLIEQLEEARKKYYKNPNAGNQIRVECLESLIVGAYAEQQDVKI